ncbi:MAG: cell division protein ZapA [Bacteroidales bacterium]|jgi:cell division protein ZapA (FtsZ GTPase activity inhibitor)|nr:cell division protein ZapA [Bacteroidales bacterium]HHV40248.1 cell division protein ZapA [Bacteroidales bacterium]
MSDSKLSIKISIADRYYPLRIAREDEEMVRAAAQRINQRIEQFNVKYSGQDTQDALAMASLQFVMSLLKHEKADDIHKISTEIASLNNFLGEYLER